MNRSSSRAIVDDGPRLSDAVWAPVLEVLDETPRIRTIRIARPRGFDFQPGQTLGVTVEVGDLRLARRYSISSAPESAGWLDITVLRRGVASTALHESVGAGSLLSIDPPGGSFVYPAANRRPIVLVGGGIGCAPLMSMFRHALKEVPPRPVTFLVSARTAADVPFRKELNAIARSGRARVGVTLTRESSRPGYVIGRVDSALLRRAAPDLEDSLFFLCGPPAMVEETRKVLESIGVPASHVLSERFLPPGEVAFPAEPEPLLPGAAPAPPAAAAAGVSAAGAGAGAVPLPFTERDLLETTRSRRSRRELAEEEISQRLDLLLKTGRFSFPPTLPDRDPGEETWTGRLLRFPQVIREVHRFRRAERLLHWSIAIPFLVCFATGMTLKLFYALHPEGVSRDVLAFLHRVAGGSLLAFPLLSVLSHWKDLDIHIYNVKVGWLWTWDDVKWLFLMGPATFSERFTLPDARKFNAGERLNFMMVMSTWPLFVATGLVLWTPGIHFVPWVAHVAAALVAAPLMAGHIFMALVNPSTRVGLSGMITGKVDREWARHHYAAWYRDHFDEHGNPKAG